jgi:hypothetical protein
MQPIYRQLLKLMPRPGAQVTDLGPCTAVVSRRSGRVRTALGPGADLLTADMGRYAVTGVGQDTWVVARAKALGEWTSVRLGDRGARLLLDEQAGADERRLQPAAALRRFGYTGRIVSFEPTADAFERLSKAAADDPSGRCTTSAWAARTRSAPSTRVGTP